MCLVAIVGLLRQLKFAVASILPNSRAHPPTMPNFALLGNGSVVEISVLYWKIQPPVSTDKVIGVHEYFKYKFIKEKISLRVNTVQKV